MPSAERDIAALVRASALEPDALREQFSRFLWTGEGDFPHSTREDPHALGWLHQYLGETRRNHAFAQHTGTEAKHSDQVGTTQLYTPRWIADWLAEKCFDDAPFLFCPQVLDPACGGGQMLLAAADALVARGIAPRDAFTTLRGIDLDPEAVWACRESLKRAAATMLGTRLDAVEQAIDANVVVGDGLAEDIVPADVALTNPPYMGSRSMSADLKTALRRLAPFHHDLYLAFIRRCSELAAHSTGVLAQQTVWYLKRFEAARRDLLTRGRLTDFAHLGHGVFDGLSGEKANVVAFVWRPEPGDGPTRFWDLRDAKDKQSALDETPIERRTSAFEALPAAPIAFWLPTQLVAAFDGPRLADVAVVPGSQNKTGDNARYVKPIDEAPSDWVPYSKGGRYAPWWGNWDWAVDWSDEAREFYASNPTSNLLNQKWWFREGLCYSDFGGRHFNARWMPPGCVFDMAGPAIFVDGDDPDLLAALLVVLNSTAAREMLNALNPTLHYQVRDVRNLPLPRWDDATIASFAELGHALVGATREALGARSPAPVELEIEADELVAAAYGCGDIVTRASRRVHHRL